MQRRKDDADIAEQKAIVLELARTADSIYIGRAISVSDSTSAARFEILRTFKGNTPVGQILTLTMPQEVVVGCTASASFKNVSASTGREYVLYVVGGALVRTGYKERKYPEISVREELKQIERAVVPNKTIEPTR